MHLTNRKHLSNRQHGGLIHHAASPLRFRFMLFAISIVTTCTACHVSASDPLSNIEVKGSDPQKTKSVTSISAPTSPQTTESVAASKKLVALEKVSKPVALDPFSGTFRMAMMFDKGVKVKVKSESEGGATAQPDGSQVSFLDIALRNGKVEKCIQTSLKGQKTAQQPACTIDGDALKLVFSDGKAAFNATMEAVVRADDTGAYKGPLLIRAVIIPDGKRIGELSLTRP